MMKLVQRIKKNDLLLCDWGIYELTAAEEMKYGKRYALSQGILSDDDIKEIGVEAFIASLKSPEYEYLFETQKEAYMQVKLIEMKCKIEKMEHAFADIRKAMMDLNILE